METRLTEIEIKLTQMEDLLETLNLGVFRLQEQLMRLQQAQQLLSEQMLNMSLSEAREANQEIPPHY